MERSWAQRAVVAFAAAVVFSTSLPVPFIYWDDPIYVTASARTQTPGLAGFLQLWDSSSAWRGEGIEFFPLRDLAYWAVWQLFGGRPAAFHLLSVLIHLAVAVLVLELGVAIGLSRKTSFWGALLFAVHPIHVESVTWVSGLKDPLCGLLMIAAVLSYARHRREGRRSDYAWCLAFMVGALLTKSVGAVTPALLLAYDWLQPRGSWREALTRLLGPAVISALFLVQFVLIGRANGVLNPPHGGSWGQHVFLMGWAFTRYVQQALVPATFRIHYCFPNLESPLDPRLLGIAAALTALALAVRFSRAHRLAGFLLAWFLACLAPVANLIPFPAIMADRYLYLPSVAACLALGWGLEQLAPRLQGPVRAAIIVIFGLVTLGRGVFWQDEGNLWAEAVEGDVCLEDHLPQAAVMYFKYGESIEDEDPQAALEAYRKGVTHRAFHDLDATSRANFLSGAAFAARQGHDEALAHEWLEGAIALRPDPETMWQLGAMRLTAHQLQGVEQLAVAISLEPARYCPRLEGMLSATPQLQHPRLEQLRAACHEAP